MLRGTWNIATKCIQSNVSSRVKDGHRYNRFRVTRGRKAFCYCTIITSEPVRPRPRTASQSRHFAALPLALIIYLSAKSVSFIGRAAEDDGSCY